VLYDLVVDSFTPDNPSWTHDKRTCKCVRCTGFQPGHKLSPGAVEKHGAYKSPLTLAPEAEAIAVIVREQMPVQSPAFEGTLQSYCILLARIQRAHVALEKVEADKDAGLIPPEEEPLAYLRDEIRKWTSSGLKHAVQLGLTPMSASAIARNISGGQDVTKPPTQEDLKGVSLEKLREVHRAITAALTPDEYVDA